MNSELAADVEHLNTIISWLARRDLPSLSGAAALPPTWGHAPADAILLLGGIPHPALAETVASGLHAGVARTVMLVGGAGHSTQRLRDAVAGHARFGGVATVGRAEADILLDVLAVLGVPRAKVALVEAASTNCGNNASFALRDAAASGPLPRRVVLVQDPLMQRRSHENFLYEWRATETQFASFAPCVPMLIACATAPERVAFADPTHAAWWPMKPFLDLVMGEVPRLRPTGYGPQGSAFIGHVDVPPAVDAAHEALLPRWSQHVREAVHA